MCNPSSDFSFPDLDFEAAKGLIKLYNKYACRLAMNRNSLTLGIDSDFLLKGQNDDDVLLLFQHAQKLADYPHLKDDQAVQVIRKAIWNNLSQYCCR